jgi:hypothetical protein
METKELIGWSLSFVGLIIFGIYGYLTNNLSEFAYLLVGVLCGILYALGIALIAIGDKK